MTPDPLSEILTLVEARSVVTGGLFAAGAWSLRFQPREVKFYAFVKGGCWMLREGHKVPLRLEAGDVVLIADRHPFVLASDLSEEPRDARALFSVTVDNFATLGSGEEFSMLAGHVALDPIRGALLLDALPPLIHLCGSSPEAITVQQLLVHLYSELRTERPGNRLAATMLTQLVFVQALRAHLATSGSHTPGWLRALGDERIAPALRQMHSDPGRSWSLEELAKASCMSRSAFALRFKTVAGVAPLTYLLYWRMRLAERSLLDGGVSVSALASTLGYTSESAFSNAFKRVVGVAPKHYRAAANPARQDIALVK